MANKKLFSNKSVNVPVATSVNRAGGIAYEMSDMHALAQLVCTGTFNSTYYASAQDNLELVKKYVQKLRGNPEFVAKVALYARNCNYMKDTPAYLCAVLAAWGESKLFRRIFPMVINNVKMLRNFVQIGRSGEAGKVLNMSSGCVRRAINDWFNVKSSDFIFKGSIGNNPTMKDVLKMARPKPNTEEKAALFAYLLDYQFDKRSKSYLLKDKDGVTIRKHKFSSLPKLVQDYENFKSTHKGEIPKVEFRMLDSILDEKELRSLWSSQAETGSWQLTRMNLNNFLKYKVFDNSKLQTVVAERLRDKHCIKKSNVYPYQLLMAFLNAKGNMPVEITEALQDAMEVSVDNIPKINGGVNICIDTSGSMSSAITGNSGVPSKARCIDVAALFGAAILRTNKDANVIPFDTRVHSTKLNGRDSIMTNAAKLAGFGGGGTDCSCALKYLNNNNAKENTVIFISDNESWFDTRNSGSYFTYSANLRGRGTSMMEEWTKYKKRNKAAKLICIDLTPRNNSQVSENRDILQIGGWSDQCFDIIAKFIENNEGSNDFWVKEIQKISLEALTQDQSSSIIEMEAMDAS